MPGSVQSIERAAAVLRLLAAAPDGLGVVDLGNSLGLPKGTVHGIIRTLHQVGFVDQDEAARYHLSGSLAHLGDSYLDLNELRSRAINWADALAARSGEVVRVGRLLNREVVVVHHVFRPDDSEQDLDVGSTLPPHATALGKAVLAFDSSGTTGRRRRGKLEGFTTRTIVDPARLAEELAVVRSSGWAGEFEEHVVEQAGIAAPIRGLGGLVVGAVGLSGPVARVCDSRLRLRQDLIALVRSAAEEIGHDVQEPR